MTATLDPVHKPGCRECETYARFIRLVDAREETFADLKPADMTLPHYLARERLARAYVALFDARRRLLPHQPGHAPETWRQVAWDAAHRTFVSAAWSALGQTALDVSSTLTRALVSVSLQLAIIESDAGNSQ